MPMETITNLKSEIDESLTQSGFYWRETQGVKALICRPLEVAGFANAFSTRLGGVSAFPENSLNLAGYDEDSVANIEENRRRFLEIFDAHYTLATVWQTHSADVRAVENLEDAKDDKQKFDALVSDLKNVLIGVKTADCVPVLLGDTRTKSFAAVHAGWRGTANSIVVRAIEKMRERFGTKAKNLICAVGPAATRKNYEIGRDVIDAFTEKFPTCGNLFHTTRENHALIDLHLANREQLQSVGVAKENIFTAPLCTMERTDLFFSYRVEKKIYGKTGRLLSVIGVSEPSA